MNCVHHCDTQVAEIYCAAFVKADGFNAFSGFPVRHKIILADNGYLELFGQWKHIGDMVKMGVGEQNVGCALDGLVRVCLRAAWDCL